jgi:hypothetical protein
MVDERQVTEAFEPTRSIEEAVQNLVDVMERNNVVLGCIYVGYRNQGKTGFLFHEGQSNRGKLNMLTDMQNDLPTVIEYWKGKLD